MSELITRAVQAVSAAKGIDLALVGAVLLLSAGLHVLHVRFRTKGAAGPLALCKWLAALAALHLLDVRVLEGEPKTALFALYALFIWLAFRVFLHDIYAGLYMGRVRGLQVNKIHLSLVSFLALVVLVVSGLHGVLGVDVSSLMTSSAILTAVVGLSMQDTIGSLMSGLLIQTEKPFKIGDWVRIGDQEGRVAEITWRYTKLVTFSDNQLLIPNNAIAKERLLNISEPIQQVNVAVNIPAPLHVPPVKAKSALEDVLRRAKLVAPLPAPRVRMHEIGPDHILYRAVFYVQKFDDTVTARNEVLSAAWYEFRKHGIELPMPLRMMVPEPQPQTVRPTPELLEMLGNVGLFEGMRPGELELLVQCAGARVFPAGATIVSRGQNTTNMFIIVDGHVSVRVGAKELAVLVAGDMFGEMALLTGEPRTADVVALDTCQCLELDREAFRTVLEHNQVLMDNITRIFKAREQANSEGRGQAATQEGEGFFDRFRKIFW